MSRPPKPLKYPRRPIGPHESSQETEKPALRRPGCPFWPRPGSDPGRVRREPQKGARSAPLKLAGDPGTYAGSVPRKPRVQIPGGIYHLGTRGVRRESIYAQSGDYELFGSIFGRVVD